MPVNERPDDPGSFTIRLDREKVPFDELRLVKEMGHIVITPQWHLHPGRYAEADLLASARYSGILMNIDTTADSIILWGQGNVRHLGTDDGAGAVPTLGADVTYSAASVTSILTSIASGGILPPAITAGTITTTGVGTFTGTFYATQSCLSAVRTVMKALNMHYRINPDWTLDACLATRDDVYTVTSPTVVAVPKGFGADPTYTGIEADSLETTIDASHWAARSVIENVDTAGARSVLSQATRVIVPYQDPHGSPLNWAVIQSGPSSTDVGYTTFHSQTLDEWDTRKEQQIDTSQFDFSGPFQAGDWIWAYAPELGLVDTANQINYRGRYIAPIAMQVPEDDWPVVAPPMGVYYRPSRTSYAQAVISDGATGYWRLGEASGTTAADEISTNDMTYFGTPTLGAAGVMDDGNGDTAVTLSGSGQAATGADWADFDFASGAFSIEAWFTADVVTGSTKMIVHKRSGTPQGWEFGVGNGGVFFADDNVSAVLSHTISAGTEYYVVVTYDGSSTARMYVNGKHVDTTGALSITANTAAVSIGWDAAQSSFYFDGTLDEVALYDRQLYGLEIAEHYAIGTQGTVGGRWVDLTRYVRSDAA